MSIVQFGENRATWGVYTTTNGHMQKSAQDISRDVFLVIHLSAMRFSQERIQEEWRRIDPLVGRLLHIILMCFSLLLQCKPKFVKLSRDIFAVVIVCHADFFIS